MIRFEVAHQRSVIVVVVFFPKSSLLHTRRQPYPRLIFIETEVVTSPSANNPHVVIAQYNVVGLFTASSSTSTTMAAGWLLHVASQVTSPALVAGCGQFLNWSSSFPILANL
jgi:hypothetical protein